MPSSLLTYGTHNPPAKQYIVGMPSMFALHDSIVACKAPDGEPAWLCTWRASTGFVLGRINVTTEEFTQLTVPFQGSRIEERGLAMVYSPTEAATYLICTPYLSVFRVADSGTTVEYLERSAGAGYFASQAVVDSTGKIWWGLAPYGAYLISYNPATAEYYDHGNAHEGNMYCYPFIDDTDTIWCWMPQDTTKRLAAYDIARSTFTDSGLAVTGGGTLSVYPGTDNKVYVTTSGGTYQYRYSYPAITFIQASGTEKFAYTQPDGTTYEFADAENWTYQLLTKIPPSGPEVEISCPYTSNGTGIFAFTVGPDSKVYISTAIPNILAMIDPDDLSLTAYGRASYFDGHTYGWVNYNGYLYQFSYGYAYCSKYDPAAGYLGWETNPTNLGRISSRMYRPSGAVLVGSDAYVIGWTSTALNAPHPMTKFSLVTETGEDFAPHDEQQLMCIADAGGGLLLIGTNVGLGMDPTRTIEAILWDTATDTVYARIELSNLYDYAWACCVISGTAYVLCRAWEVGGDRLLIIDIATQTITDQVTVPGQMMGSTGSNWYILQDDGNGNVLMTAATGIYLLNTTTYEWTTLKLMRVTAAGPLVGIRLFFARDATAYYIGYP